MLVPEVQKLSNDYSSKLPVIKDALIKSEKNLALNMIIYAI